MADDDTHRHERERQPGGAPERQDECPPECRHVRDQILESFDDAGDARDARDAGDAGEARGANREHGKHEEHGSRVAIDAHLAICPSCAAFAAGQQALDARLRATLVPPALSPAFRATLRARLREEVPVPALASHAEAARGRAAASPPWPSASIRPVRSLRPSPAWRDALPDIVHFASCAVATLACALVLPVNAIVTIGAGTSAALLTYVLLTTVRDSFEAIDQPDP